MNRRRYNFRILKLLFLIFCKFPDMRFLQLLFNAGLIDDPDYNQEPRTTYERLKSWYDSKIG